jgi:hypothetical protein
MVHGFVADAKLCARLLEIDEALAAQIQCRRCPHCGARLDRGDFPRKPRGGAVGAAGEIFDRRISLCCSADGCRRRQTPPSVRFLGRRVYLGIVVLLASVIASASPMPSPSTIGSTTGVPTRTLRRWLTWWRNTLISSAAFAVAAARFVPALDVGRLPASLLERFVIGSDHDRLVAAIRWLSPWSCAAPTRS